MIDSGAVQGRLGPETLGSAELGSFWLGSTRLGQLDLTRLGSAWLGSDPVGSAQLHLTRVCSAWLGSGRLGLAQLSSVSASGRLGFAGRVRFTPTYARNTNKWLPYNVVHLFSLGRGHSRGAM